jgi:hypothetical protein
VNARDQYLVELADCLEQSRSGRWIQVMGIRRLDEGAVSLEQTDLGSNLDLRWNAAGLGGDLQETL